jgi:hypothetical protein
LQSSGYETSRRRSLDRGAALGGSREARRHADPDAADGL